jgi:2'-5' RNA ligase
MSTASARLFTALWPDDALRAAFVAQRERWMLPKAARRVHAERLHLTLHFIGDLERERIAPLRAALRDVPVEPFELVLDRTVVWGRDVASLLASAVPPELRRLHAAAGAVLERAGVPAEQRPWQPHVTLARRAGAVPPPAEPFVLRWRIDEFVLVESELRPPARYVVLERYSRTSATGCAPKSARSR